MNVRVHVHVSEKVAFLIVELEQCVSFAINQDAEIYAIGVSVVAISF